MNNFSETIPASKNRHIIVGKSDAFATRYKSNASASNLFVYSDTLSPSNGSFFSSNSGTIFLEAVTDQAGSEVVPMPADEFKLLCDAIDNQIAAMTHDQYIEALLATAGAWADLENLTDDGFTDMPWGFDRYQIGDQDAPKLPV